MTINVVYLSYFNKEAGYDLEVLEEFLSSYRNKPAGISHSLTIIAKNWTDKSLYEKLCNLAEQNNAKVIDLPDDGWDFGAYFRVAKLLDDEYLFFIGTATLICSENWLLYHYNAFKSDKAVQLAGAMGSWGYIKELNLRPFPNFHIRTCAFMMKRELFLEYASIQKFPVNKEDTYELEHGKNSITKFVLDKGYNTVVVNNLGKVYSPANWVFSGTFRYPNKMNTLLADKHAVFYHSLDDNTRRGLERRAWGWSLKDTRIKIFVAHHRPAPLLESDVFQLMFNGTNTFISPEYGLRDNIGINIADKNTRYRELTGHYWVWKNMLPYMDTEYIGFFHYHRFLDFNISLEDNTPFKNVSLLQFKDMCVDYSEENIMKCVQGYDAVLPKKYFCEQSIYELYSESSPDDELDTALDIIIEDYPEYIEAAKTVLSGNELYACLIFVMKKELVCEYMEWIFGILTTLEQKIDWSKYEDSVANQIFVNIAEIFFNIWLVHNVEAKSLKISETTSAFIMGM